MAIAATSDTISILFTITSKSEIVSAIQSLSSGKAAAIDGIPAEFYKSN